MAKNQTTRRFWVLAYTLKFRDEEGDWPQVHRTAYATEAEAIAARAAMSRPEAYHINVVEMPASEQTAAPDAVMSAMDTETGPLPDAVVAAWETLATNEQTTKSVITIELGKEDDGRWIADIPSLPGCMAYGSTCEYAKAAVLALAARVLSDREYHNEPK